MEHIVRDWINDYKDLDVNNIKPYVDSLSDVDLLNCLFDSMKDKQSFEKHGETICNQLFQYYQSDHIELRRFVLQFIPSVIYFYLNAIASGEREPYKYVEVLLIGIYNFEVTDSEGKPKVVTFRVPSLAQNSLYHEPLSFQSTALTESALKRFEQGHQVSWGPLNTLKTFTAHNRLLSLAALLVIFNRNIGHFSKVCLYRTCLVASMLASQGFSRFDSDHKASESMLSEQVLPNFRITLSPELMLELLQSVYYIISNSPCMTDDEHGPQYPFLSITSCNSRYNDLTRVAIQALEDMQFRSHFEMYSEVAMVAASMMNSIKLNENGQLYTVGISNSTSTSHPTPTNKALITNASFRIKKLPDDIPIPTPEDPKKGKVLASINEEDSDININKPKVRDKLALLKKKDVVKGKDGDEKEKDRKLKDTLADKLRSRKDNKSHVIDDLEQQFHESEHTLSDGRGHSRHHSSSSVVKHDDGRTFIGSSSLTSVGPDPNREHVNGMAMDPQ